MSSILGQVSYPVFISGVFVFFIIVSIFSFIVGLGLATRSATMLRFIAFMNRGFSMRRTLRPLTMPHFVEPTLLKRPVLLGVAIILGAITSVVLLKELEAGVFEPVYNGAFDAATAQILSGYTRSFLLVGNILCVLVGLLVLFFPHLLSSIEGYTDKWYTLRKQTRPLTRMHFEIDRWVLAHPTVSGVTLSLMSLGLSFAMYARI